MGDRSGEQGGQCKIEIELSAIHYSVDFDRCEGALGCWNVIFTDSKPSIYGNKLFYNMFWYVSAVNFSEYSMRGSMPCAQNTPHTIQDFPPHCLRQKR